MFGHRRGISLFGTNTPSCGISLSGINYSAIGSGTRTTFDKYSDEYMKIKVFIQENFMTPLIRKDMDIIKLNSFNFDYLLKKLNNYALMFKDTGIFINLNEEIILPILVTLLVGTPALSFIGCMGASLTLSIKWHGLIMPIIILPLFIPVLIFGSGAISTILFSGLEELYFRQVAILSGISGLSVVFCPLISSYIIRTNYE